MPMNRSGRSVEEASRVIEIDDVLVPMIASGLRTGHSAENILSLTSSFSAAVSITRSQSAMASSASAGVIRASALCRSSSLISFLETWRAMLPLMVARPDMTRSGARSLSSTGKPASAHTWAMPLPIWPAPMTPTLRMLSFISLVRFPALFYDDWGRDTTGPQRHFGKRLLAELGELGRKLRQGLVQVGDETVIGDLEDRRLFVLVDRHDDLGVLHAGEVLDRPGYPHRDVELGRHHLAGLADLPVVGRVAGVDSRARGADRRAQLVGDRLDVLGEVFPALHRAAARDH